MSKTVLFQTIQFSISIQFSSIWLIDRTLPSATTPGQNELGSDGNKGKLCIPQSSRITEDSPSDCLVSYPGHLSGEFYPYAEMQLVNSVAPADSASTFCYFSLIWNLMNIIGCQKVQIDLSNNKRICNLAFIKYTQWRSLFFSFIYEISSKIIETESVNLSHIILSFIFCFSSSRNISQSIYLLIYPSFFLSFFSYLFSFVQ